MLSGSHILNLAFISPLLFSFLIVFLWFPLWQHTFKIPLNRDIYSSICAGIYVGEKIGPHEMTKIYFCLISPKNDFLHEHREVRGVCRSDFLPEWYYFLPTERFSSRATFFSKEFFIYFSPPTNWLSLYLSTIFLPRPYYFLPSSRYRYTAVLHIYIS